MNLSFIKYNLFFTLVCCNCLLLVAQQPVSNNHNVVTIIGDPLPMNTAESSNIYVDKSAPPVQKQSFAAPKNISPSLENGFHIRFEIEADAANKNTYASASASSLSGEGYSKPKRHKISFTEQHFNIKKRFKSWIPKSKKKYRPHVCGRM